MSQAASNSSQGGSKRKGVFFSTIRFFWLLLATALISLVLSIIIELIGMHFWWEDEGVNHSRNMLRTEAKYLLDDYQDTLLTSDVRQTTKAVSGTLYEYMVVKTGLHKLESKHKKKANINTNQAGELTVGDHLEASINIIRLFIIRLVIIMLSAPLFVLFAIHALIKGSMQRSLRTWGAGRESSFIFHHSKRLILPIFMLPLIVYLSFPMAIHPSVILFPTAFIFSYSLYLAAASFKKYL